MSTIISSRCVVPSEKVKQELGSKMREKFEPGKHSPRSGDYLESRLVLNIVVEVRGLEPLTSCMPCKRSPN